MSETTVKYPASLVPVGQFAGKPAVPLTRSVIVVGSSKHSRILLKSDTVSSVHTLLINSNGRWYFRDLVSRTHTILNGKSVRESVLKNGDTITIGAFVFHFVAPEPVVPIQPPAPAALDITDAEMPVPIDTRTVLIGKRPGCEIRLMEEGVSTAHAVIFEHDGRHFIRDLYSRGGTTLNGKKIHQEPLKFGDVVVVGETTIRYIPDHTANVDLLSEAHAPAIAIEDEAMESRDVPLVARHLDEPEEPPVQQPTAPIELAPAPVVTPAASKPAEILANLPPGLSSLLGELPGSVGRAVAKAKPAELIQEPPPMPETLLVPIEPVTTEAGESTDGSIQDTSPPTVDLAPAEDDLVVPLRRRGSLGKIEPIFDEPASPARVETPAEVEPSAIAPEVDEIRETGDTEPVSERDLVSQADVEALQPAVELVPEVEPTVSESPAVANRPLEVDVADSQEKTEDEPVEAVTVSVDHEPQATEVDEIDLADEVELAEGLDEQSDVAPVDETPSNAEEVVLVEDAAADSTVAVEAVADEIADETPAVETVPPLDPSVFAEQIRRDFAEEDAKAVAESEESPEEPEPIAAESVSSDPESMPAEEAVEEPTAEAVAEVAAEPEAEVPAVAEEPATPAPTPISTIADSPELRQLADLQARIAAALRDPSTISTDPVLPPDAPLVSDPTTAMSAAARRARLIAEMLDTTEPIEEEAEREAQAITFDLDESSELPEAMSVEDQAADEPAPIAELLPAELDESGADGLPAEPAAPEAEVPLEVEPIDIADTLPADIARGEEVFSGPLADLLTTERAETYPTAPVDVEVEAPEFTLPNAVAYSESPGIAEPESMELPTPAPDPLGVPAAEALDAPLELDEIEPTLPASAQDVVLPRTQDVFDAVSIDLPLLRDRSTADEVPSEPNVESPSGIESLTDLDHALADEDELREAGEVVGEPIGTSPTIDPDEPVSESADDTLLAELPAADEASRLAAEPAEGQTPVEIDQSRLPDELRTTESEATVEAEAPSDEPIVDAPSLEIEPLASPADVVALPAEQAIEVDDSIAPIEADQPHAGEVIALGSDAPVNEEASTEMPAAEVASVEVAPAASTHDATRIIDEAEEEEPLEGQSRPLIAADEHLVDDELVELPSMDALDSGVSTAVPDSETQEVPETVEPADAVTMAAPTQETPVSEAPSAPVVTEIAPGSLPAGRTPINIGQAKPTNVVNVNVPSLEDLQAEFDNAFNDALAMAEGQSFAGTKPTPKPESISEAPAKPQAEYRVEDVAATDKSGKVTKPGVIDLKVPSLDELESQYNDAFADALKMAEGASFAKPEARKPDEAAAPPVQPPARSQRAMPEFKLDESLLDQAQNVSPLGGSAAATGPAAFMNLGGIGWIGDPSLDDFEVFDQKKKPKPRRSRQRRPIGDQRPPTVAEQIPETSESPSPVGSAPASEVAAGASGPVNESPLVTPDAPDDADVFEVPADLNSQAEESTGPVESGTSLVGAHPSVEEDLDREDQTSVLDDAPAEEVPAIAEQKAENPSVVPTILPPRPIRARKGEAVVDQAIAPGSASPFAAQELPLVDAFSQLPTPQLDEVLARLNTTGGTVKDHPPISQDRPLSDGKEVKVPASPFASQIPIAQPAGSVRRVRQRVSKLPLITGLMLGATLMTGTLTWFIPVPRTVRGEVTFYNLNNVTELIRTERQREMLAKLGDLQRAARARLEDMYGGGFLDKREEYVEIVRNARFDPKHPELLVIEVPSNVNQASADQKRLTALLDEFVKANKNLLDDQNRLKDETREIERAQTAISTDLAEKSKRYDELGVIYETGTVISTQLKKVEKELALLEESRKTATREVDQLEAELQRLEKQMFSSGINARGSYLRPMMGIALADASGGVAAAPAADPHEEVLRLRRQREDVKARLDRLTAARSPETAAARESFDRALDAFSKQVEDARSTLGDRPEVLEYVQSATLLQDQIRLMTDTLVRRQEQQITRLNEFQMRLNELIEANKEERVSGDPQMKEWMDRLSIQERRLNVAKESNATVDEITEIERDISFLKSSIAAQQEVLADPKELTIVTELEKMIEETRKDMAADRRSNEAKLAEVQNTFQIRQPVIENLPVEQRQLTESLTERLAQINLARQRYTDSLAAVAGTDEALIADATAQLESLDKSISLAEARAEEAALAQSRVMEQRTEIARQVDEVRSKAIAARASRDAIEKQYYEKLAARDALTGKLTDWKAAMVERDDLKKKMDASEARRSELIARKQQVETHLKFAIVPLPISEPVVLRTGDSDPRLKYFGLGVMAILAVGGALMAMEIRNRIPVPPAPESSADDGPLSHTPTVA